MGALRTGKDSSRVVWLGRRGLRKGDLNLLGAQQAHAGSAMLPATPILPEQGSRSHLEWMQQNTDAARFCGLPAMPLALLSQRTPSTLTDASGIDQTQAAIAFSALFGCRERLIGGAAQGPINQAEARSLALRGGRLSRARRESAGHNPRKGLAAGWSRGQRGQTRWYAPGSAPTDDPAPGAGSRPIEI